MRRRARLALGLILLVAFTVRGMETRFGLPYLHHWDEPALGHRALGILETGDWNPHFFHYPSLLLYLNAGVDVLHYFHLVSQPEDDPTALTSLDEVVTGDENDPWYISHPSFYRWNRLLTALFGTVAVGLAFLLARRLWPEMATPRGDDPDTTGADLAGLLAALALATLPFHIHHSSYLTTDVPAATLAFAVVLLSVRFVQDRRPGDLIAAAALVGFAASTKYNLASAWAVPVVALLSVRAGRARSAQGCLDRPGYRPWLWAVVTGLPAVCFLVGTPFALADLRTFLDHVGYELRHYLVLGHDPVTVEPGWPHLIADLERLTAHAGGLVILPALVGLAVALRRGVGWLAFLLPLLQLLLTARTSALFHRNLMILYPAVAVAFGLGAVALVRMLSGVLETRRPAWRRPAVVAAWALVGVLLGVRAVQVFADGWDTWTTPETRSQAVHEINRRATAARDGQPGPERRRPPLELRIAAELEMHPLDLQRLELPYRVEPLARIACRPEPRTRVLVPRRVAAWIAAEEPRVERLNRLLERGGVEVFALPGRDTLLTHFSVNPAVVLRQPWSWTGEGPAPDCGG